MAAGSRDRGAAGTRSTAGEQGWLFERPPQDAECESMKPPRRLGKGLAALVDLHGGSLVTSADDVVEDDAASGSVLHLLSTEPAGRPPPVVPVAAVVEEPVAAVPEAVAEIVPEEPVEQVSEGFTDEWFDPPIGGFSPVSGFQRVEPATPEPEPPPEPIRTVAPPPPPPPEPEPVRAAEPVLDDPVIVDDGVFFDDVVVGSFLPDVDLDG